MTIVQSSLGHAPESRLVAPPWAQGASGQGPESAAFFSGAALSSLHQRIQCSLDPWALLRDRLALRAAETCLTHSGRPERAAELRDEIHLLRPGDLPGPGGATYQVWRQAVARPVTCGTLSKALPKETPEQVAQWLEAGQGTPVARAAAVLRSVLEARPHAEATALILADAALAQALGWRYMVPLLGIGLKSRDLKKTEEDLRLACHRAIPGAAAEVIGMANDLARRSARLLAVQPKLRAKNAEEAVHVFLSQDAVMPAALPLPGRAARRLCDRLVDLGVVRELTGRDTFRLYGV